LHFRVWKRELLTGTSLGDLCGIVSSQLAPSDIECTPSADRSRELSLFPHGRQCEFHQPTDNQQSLVNISQMSIRRALVNVHKRRDVELARTA
jgi:hypothetical protein